MKHTIHKDVPASELSAIFDEHIVGYKAARNREIMRSRYIDGLTFEELAERHNVSVQSAKYIVYKCLEKISSFI